MTIELPIPLVSAEVDLRDFAFMPLDVLRLRDSDIVTKAKPIEFRCAVLLWCVSWHQEPAASLPDDDDMLSQYAGFGCVVKEWKKVKAGALRGWVKCSDGRLYHPVVAEKANDAWRAKLKQRWYTECSRIKKHAQRHKMSLVAPEFEDWLSQGCPQGHALPVPKTSPDCPQGQPGDVPGETASKGSEGKGQGISKLNPISESSVEEAEPPPQEPPPANATQPTREGVLCRKLRIAGIQDAAPHLLLSADWQALLAKRTDEQIIAVAENKVSQNPGRRISLNYLAPALAEEPKPISQGGAHETRTDRNAATVAAFTGGDRRQPDRQTIDCGPAERVSP